MFYREIGINVNLLLYQGLIRVISNYIKTTGNKVTNDSKTKGPVISTYVRKIITSPKEEKYTYKILIHNNDIPTCETKWNSEFSHIDWKSVHSLVFDISKETYIQWIMGTKSRMINMNIATDNLCTFCNEGIENITHLFWICRYTQEIIRFAIHFINRNRQYLPIQLTCQDMILGITNSTKMI